MEWNTTKQTIHTTQLQSDATEERAVDMDIVMPDYCEPISAVLKCTMKPIIGGRMQNGDRYCVDGMVVVRVLYVSDDRQRIHCYEATQPFHVAFRSQEGIHHLVSSKVDYVNCRVMAPRRLDIHGAFRLCLQSFGVSECEIFAPPSDPNVFCKTTPVNCTRPLDEYEKTFSVEDMVDLGVNIDRLLYSEVTVSSWDCKPLINKVIVKGMIMLKTVCGTDNDCVVNTQEIPFSQIVDIDGMSEDGCCEMHVRAGEHECRLQSAEVGNNLLVVNVKLAACIRRFSTEETVTVSDAYSVKEQLICELSPVSIYMHDSKPMVKTTMQQHIDAPEGSTQVVDMWGELKTKELQHENGSTQLCCSVLIGMICKEESGHMVFSERLVDMACAADDTWTDAEVDIVSVRHTLSGKQLRVQVDCRISPQCNNHHNMSVVSNVFPDEHTTYAKSAAPIRIVYAEQGDTLWDIAKAHHASVDEIIAENDIHDDVLLNPTMLMIPMM